MGYQQIQKNTIKIPINAIIKKDGSYYVNKMLRPNKSGVKHIMKPIKPFKWKTLYNQLGYKTILLKEGMYILKNNKIYKVEKYRGCEQCMLYIKNKFICRKIICKTRLSRLLYLDCHMFKKGIYEVKDYYEL